MANVTNLLDAETQNFSQRYSKTRGWSKAYDEMHYFIRGSMEESSMAQSSANNESMMEKKRILRRSPRLNMQPDVLQEKPTHESDAHSKNATVKQKNIVEGKQNSGRSSRISKEIDNGTSGVRRSARLALKKITR